MPFDESLILSAVDRFRRERDRYIKLADRVAEICREEIIEQDVIRAQITSRAKSVSSFKGKLERFQYRGDKNFDSLDDIFKKVGDLSGVRIAAYSSTDCERIASLICKRFSPPNGEALVPDIKDKNEKDKNNFYKAIHCQVALPEEDLIGTYENLSDTTCEIQICSMMAHVWNEVEHDIVYKPSGGEPGSQTRQLLKALGSSVRSGDLLISMLLDVTDKPNQSAQQDESLDNLKYADVHDFVSRSRLKFGVDDFSKNAGLLYQELVKFGFDRPSRLSELFQNSDQNKLIDEIRDFNYFLQKESNLTLDADTSDLLVMPLLRLRCREIIESYKGRVGHGKGRANRVYRLAKNYVDFIS